MRTPQAADGISAADSLRSVSFSGERASSSKDAEPPQIGARQKALARPTAPVAASAKPTAENPLPTGAGGEVRQFGRLLLIGVDRLGRRAACRCDCGQIGEISVEALEGGLATLCGCTKPPTHPPTDPTFSRVNWGKVR